MNNECFDLVREREPERERDRERDPVREPERARESQRKPQREPQRATEILSASSWLSLTLWFSLAPLALSGSLCLSLALSDSLRLSLSLSGFAHKALAWLTRPLLGSERRSCAPALYSGLVRMYVGMFWSGHLLSYWLDS